MRAQPKKQQKFVIKTTIRKQIDTQQLAAVCTSTTTTTLPNSMQQPNHASTYLFIVCLKIELKISE